MASQDAYPRNSTSSQSAVDRRGRYGPHMEMEGDTRRGVDFSTGCAGEKPEVLAGGSMRASVTGKTWE